MFGGLTTLLASEIGGVVRRNLTVYGLLIAALVVMVAAIAYALGALHTWLALSHGPIAASLWIAGGLALVALVLVVSAMIVKRRRRPGPPIAAAALAATPVAASLLGSRKGWRIVLAGAVAVLGVALGRQAFKSGDDDQA